jgi:hypothetical protein
MGVPGRTRRVVEGAAAWSNLARKQLLRGYTIGLMSVTLPPDAARTALQDRITSKRDEVHTFIVAEGPRKQRLLNTTILGGSLAAALNAGPAIGGAPFTAWLTGTFGLTSPAWQLLCGAAAVCSISATVATQLLKSRQIEERLARAESCRAKLDVLEVGLSTGHIDVPQATSEFLRCLEDTAFLPGSRR